MITRLLIPLLRRAVGCAFGCAVGCAIVTAVAAQVPASANEQLWEAARAGDPAAIAAALDRGADVNAKSRYDVTALMFAAGSQKLDAVKLLVARGADVNAEDSFYHGRAAEMISDRDHADVAIFLLQNGADADASVSAGVEYDSEPLVKAAIAGKVSRQGLSAGYGLAGTMKKDALASLIKAALDRLPAEPSAAFSLDPSILPKYAGRYRHDTNGVTMGVVVAEGRLLLQRQAERDVALVPSAPDAFRVGETGATITFAGRGGLIESLSFVQGPVAMTLVRGNDAITPGTAAVAPPRVTTSRPSPPRNWPSFRGDAGAGNGDGQRAVSEWNVTSGKNIRWKTVIPGVATSSPIVWGNRVFATTAVGRSGNNTIKTGLYGDVQPVEDLSEHDWKIYSVDAANGKIVWERTAWTGIPKTKRHTKSSQSSSTPVTDGQRVVAVFGSAGLMVAWDFNGKELWRVDLGRLDSGWFFDPSFQWGHGSSPIIYRNTVILQVDVQKGSYIAAWNVATGQQMWKANRADEISTWGTPTIARATNGREVLVTNGTKIRGYDPATGALLWTLGPNSEITIGTPVAGDGLVFVTGGYPPARPVYAVRPDARGDISLKKGQESSDAVVWSNMTEGTYIPTPLLYNGLLITLNVNGVVTAYHAQTGQRAFRERVGMGGSFSASPVAADGKLYVSSEDGDIYVVTAAPGLAVVAKNEMKEVVMATPAISSGLIVVRTIGHLYGIGQ